MSTRAIYQFKWGGEYEWQQNTATIYIHHDGYPEGAATYFYRMLCMPSKGNLATQFIRANDGAELTDDHEIHGDAEYRYDIAGSGPEAFVSYKRRMYGNDQWGVGSAPEPLFKFIHRYGEKLFGQDELPYSLFRRVQVCRYAKNGSMLNLHTAKLELYEERYGILKTLRIWSKNGHTTCHNWQSKVEELERIVTEFPELETEEILGFLATKTF